MRGVEPSSCGSYEDEDGCPFEEDGGDGEVLCAAGFDHVEDAGGEVGDEEGDEDRGDPEVDDGV